MAGTLLSSRVPCQWPPCALSMAALVPDGAGDAYSVAPSPTPRTTLAGSDSGPLRKALLLPLGASTTALPVPLQLLSADWILDVSGGDDSALLLNCSLLVASVALSVLHADGTDGWLTERLSPVASVSAVAALAGDDAKTAGTTAAPAPRMRADAASAPVRAFTCPATAGIRAITEFSSLTGRDGSAHAQPSPSAGCAATSFRGGPRHPWAHHVTGDAPARGQRSPLGVPRTRSLTCVPPRARGVTQGMLNRHPHPAALRTRRGASTPH